MKERAFWLSMFTALALGVALVRPAESQTDNISDISSSAAATAPNALALTPNDTLSTFLSSNTGFQVTRGLYVGGAGNVVVVMKNGQTVTFTGVTAGSVLPIRVQQVKSTNTTATSIVALW